MKIGTIYPQTALKGDPAAFVAFVRATEKLGYESLSLFEHVAGAVREDRDPPLWGPYTEKDPFHDPFVAFGYAAAITRHIELVTGILVLPQRQTLLVARQAADVDLLSGGRLRLGVGVGWNHVEFDSLGEDFHTRGKRMSEQMVLLRQLWAESPLSFHGKFHLMDRIGLNPLPGRAIPIWCGGVTEPAYRRAARLADGFIFGGRLDERVMSGWLRIGEMLAEEGRAPDTFGGDYQLPDGTGIEAAADLISRWQEAGGTHAAVRTMGLGFTEVAQHIDYIAEAAHRLGLRERT